jgi:hypothetical protein
MDNQDSQNKFFVMYMLAAALLAVIFFVHVFAGWVVTEGGWIENLTAAGHFMAVGLFICVGGRRFLREHFSTCLLVLAFGLRELDFDKRFTTMGIFKTRFYKSAGVPVDEKIIGLFVIGILLLVVWDVIRKYSKSWRAGKKHLDAVSCGVLLVGALLVLSKTADGFRRRLREFGMSVSDGVSFNITRAEEILEMGLPIVIIIAFFAYQARGKRKTGPHLSAGALGEE